MRPAICEIRISKQDDLAFVVDCWSDRLSRERKAKLGEMTRYVRALLARSASRLIIAHVPNEPDAILGWAALEAAGYRRVGEDDWHDQPGGGYEEYRPVVVHYLYVRSGARRQGVARAMLGGVRAGEYSHPAPRRWPPENGQIGRPVVVPSGWVFNAERGEL
jgi:GNAT superfamily N-acetyltransferase